MGGVLKWNYGISYSKSASFMPETIDYARCKNYFSKIMDDLQTCEM